MDSTGQAGQAPPDKRSHRFGKRQRSEVGGRRSEKSEVRNQRSEGGGRDRRRRSGASCEIEKKKAFHGVKMLDLRLFKYLRMSADSR